LLVAYRRQEQKLNAEHRRQSARNKFGEEFTVIFFFKSFSWKHSKYLNLQANVLAVCSSEKYAGPEILQIQLQMFV
jgi:uncharacterized protein YxeA